MSTDNVKFSIFSTLVNNAKIGCVTTWCVLFNYYDGILIKGKVNVIVCCQRHSLATPRGYPTAYFCAVS